jgi:F-type H+-transporting ATPase subunit gamma
MSLKTIKNKIRGIDKTRKVTRAMEAVSAVKMRKSQERALKGRPYAIAALSILERVGASLEALRHPLLAERPLSRLLLVVITSDKGLAGSLNSSVLKAAEEDLRAYNLEKESIGVIAIGRKGSDYFEKRGYAIVESVKNVNDDVRADDFEFVASRVVELFTTAAYDRVLIAYSQFKSTFDQKPMVRSLLPIDPETLRATVLDIVPQKGKYAHMQERQARPEVYTVEPDAETVLDTLLPYLLQIELYHGMLEAKASEHSARMVAMKNASDKARDLSKELTLAFNKERQAEITSEVSEIVGGIEAMR